MGKISEFLFGLAGYFCKETTHNDKDRRFATIGMERGLGTLDANLFPGMAATGTLVVSMRIMNQRGVIILKNNGTRSQPWRLSLRGTI